MATGQTGRCLCGDIAYDTGGTPLWVTVCYCSFCQRATGSDRMILPVFERASFAFTRGRPRVFALASEGSGKTIEIRFCAACGTKLATTFERWPDRLGIYAGTLHDPAAIEITPVNSKHIFVSEARPGTILPAGVKTFERHATGADGAPLAPVIYPAPHVVTG